jgi:cyclophilin family peptidyl-prolyl cis-trans isomerase
VEVTVSANVRSPLVESLEGRIFMHTGPLKVTSVIADNRGEMIITLNQPIRPSNVNTGAIQMYTAGNDGILANSDDQRVTTQLNYQSTGNRIIIRSTVPADTGYRIKLVSTRIETEDGDVHLDGEFSGTFPSGNDLSGGQGVSGGNFEFQTKNDRSSRPLMRWSTSAGVITTRMLKDIAPKTVSNFRQYADDGDFDNSFYTRSVPGFIIQGGSLQINGSNQVVEGQVRAPVVNEFNRSNTRGTIAMAKQGGDPNSATNQWFFNLADNSSNLDNQNGGFTVFSEVTNASGLTVMDAIAAKPRRDLTAQIGSVSASTDVTTVPVNTAGDGTLDPQADLVVIRRIAQLMLIRPL